MEGLLIQLGIGGGTLAVLYGISRLAIRVLAAPLVAGFIDTLKTWQTLGATMSDSMRRLEESMGHMARTIENLDRRLTEHMAHDEEADRVMVRAVLSERDRQRAGEDIGEGPT